MDGFSWEQVGIWSGRYRSFSNVINNILSVGCGYTNENGVRTFYSDTYIATKTESDLQTYRVRALSMDEDNEVIAVSDYSDAQVDITRWSGNDIKTNSITAALKFLRGMITQSHKRLKTKRGDGSPPFLYTKACSFMLTSLHQL